LLPNPALRPVYDEVVWLYVYRDFKRNEADRAAERISLRFGVTSWPQHFLVDPNTLEQVADTGRSVQTFLAAVKRGRSVRQGPRDPLERQIAAEQRADALERHPRLEAARKALSSPDIVERYAALEIVAAKDPKQIVAQAEALLAVPNDPFRYLVCGVLGRAAASDAAPALNALVANPNRSRNPNVLRIRAVQALGTCGDARSVPVVGKWASTGVYFNGLTGIAVDVLYKIKRRHRDTAKAIDRILRQGFPKPPADGNEREMRACVGLAKRIFRALEVKGHFPKVYDEAARQRLMR
jgi:hypothetical protein